MEYYTYFTLRCNGDSEEIAEVIRNNTEINKEGAKIIADLLEYGSQNLTWYDYERDIAEASVLFPNITFYLNGEGENRSDNWENHYKNGRVISRLVGKLVYEEVWHE